MSSNTVTSRLGWTHLGVAVLVAAVWGFNFVVIKVGVFGMPPLLLATLRFVFSALPALFFLPRPSVSWGKLAAYGLFLGVGEFGFLFVALKLGAPAGLSSVVLQAQAFFTAFLAALTLKERLHWNQWAGMFVAFAGLGLLVLIGEPAGGLSGLTLPLAGMLLTAAFFWAAANVTARTMPGTNALALTVWSSLFSPLPLLALSFFFEGVSSWRSAFLTLNAGTVGALVYLVVLSTLFGYGVWNHLILKFGAGRIAPFSLLVPVFGVSSAALFLGEAFTAVDAAAACLVLGGLSLHVFGGRFGRKRLS